jgi:ribosomal protein L7Ae-like RNA K-turn-binding protein
VNVLPHARLADLYARKGPFVTVYLDATRATETGPHEVQVRWADARAELEQAGGDQRTLDAIAGAVDADAHTPGRHGLVVVAVEGDVGYRDVLSGPPALPSGRLAPLPHLLPYLAQRTTEIPHLVVVADRTGADILEVLPGGREDRESVEGRTYPIHRTAADVWNEDHFQRRVENTWESNAENVAEEVRRLVRQGPAKLVIVAGDVRARTMIADALDSPPGMTVRTIDEGGRAAGSSTEALQAAVHDAVLHQVWRERREVLEHLQQNLGRHEYAVAGVAPVVEALRMSQVDTLVMSDDAESPLTAWVGPGMTDFGLDDAEAEATGVTSVQHDRLDAALIRAAVGTHARLVVTPGGHSYLPEGIGALLRFDTA